MRFNKNECKDRSFAIPPNKAVVAVNVVAKTPIYKTGDATSKKGAAMFVIACVVAKGQPGAGTYLTDFIVDNEYAASKLGAVLASLGIPTDNDVNVTAKLIVGKTGFVRIKHEEWEGETRAKIHYWMSREKGMEACDFDPNATTDEEPDLQDGGAVDADEVIPPAKPAPAKPAKKPAPAQAPADDIDPF